MAIEQSRWGIIYCPKEGIRRTHKRWEEIRDYLKEKQVPYDFVQSEGDDSVERLAGMLASNGYSTLIIVGGDAALNRALNGLLAAGNEVRHRMALGVIPNGWANDFAHFWGFDDDNYKQTIDWLVARRLRKVDVGYCQVLADEHGEKSAPRYFLNCVNVGLVADIMNVRHEAHRFWQFPSLSFFSSTFMLLFHRMESKMHLKVNLDDINRRVMTVCIGSARGYGQTPGAVPYNGMLDVSVVSHPEITQLVEGLWMLMWGRFLNHKNVKAYRTRNKIQFFDNGKARVSLDGRVWREARTPMEIGLHPEWIDFIIPS